MKSIRQLRRAAQAIVMTRDERSRIEARLRSVIAEYPMHDSAHATVSHSFGIMAFIQKPMLIAILLLLVVAGGGTVAAAEGALPGDALYPIKINITEEVRASFAFSSQAEASWAETRAARRLAEAEKLAINNALTEDTTAVIELAVERHMTHIQEIADKLEASGQTDAAASLRSNFEATLNAHGDIVIELGSKTSRDSQRQLARILNRIGSMLETQSGQRAKLEALLFESEDADTDAAAKAKAAITMAEKKIEVTTALITRASVDQKTKEAASEKLKKANANLTEALTKFETSLYIEATQKAREANHYAHEASALIQAAKRIGGSVDTKTRGNTTTTITIDINGTNAATTNDDSEELEEQLENARERFDEIRKRLENEREQISDRAYRDDARFSDDDRRESDDTDEREGSESEENRYKSRKH